ncbi:MAG TPA: STAS domain-containing protein [Patescibacteria group bacterium]|nr:STAS domain-containing protein [Patescibacteria group bacterium]
MNYEIAEKNGQRTLVLRGQLTFADRAALDQVIAQVLAGEIRTMSVDLEHLDYMDSAGLGMLLTLRDRAGKANVQVRLVKPQGDVKELLSLACFDTLFSIDS